MKLTAFQYGKTELAEHCIFAGGDPDKKSPIALLFFLIEDGAQKILVDVGCDTMPGFDLFEFQKPVEVLESCGICRDEITDIILTHGHHDHIDALRYYPTASVFVHQDAVSSLMGYLPDYTKVQAISDYAAIGRGITLQYIGGHAVGSSVVLIKRSNTTYVLCGDECYDKKGLTEGIVTGSSICPEKTKAFLEEYGKPGYTPVLSHDPDLVGKIGYKVLFED